MEATTDQTKQQNRIKDHPFIMESLEGLHLHPIGKPFNDQLFSNGTCVSPLREPDLPQKEEEEEEKHLIRTSTRAVYIDRHDLQMPSKKKSPGDKRHRRDSSLEILDQQAVEKKTEADDFVFVDDNEDSVNDFHSNHNIVKEASMKQKLYKSL
jgi:hypothetical protein